jgi:hypothetical protein
MKLHLNCAVEGLIDEAILSKILDQFSLTPCPFYGKNGKAHLKKQINNFNNAAKNSFWIVLTDLDEHPYKCAPELVRDWLSRPASKMILRVAVHEIESWILADRKNFSAFFKVSMEKIPCNPDEIKNPKEYLLNLIKTSKRKSLHKDMLPDQDNGRKEGPAYVSRIIEYIHHIWNFTEAKKNSKSLFGLINKLELLR